jgi:hypothetical protein
MAMNRTVVVIFALALGLLAACDPGMEAPGRGLQLQISTPKGSDNPFSDQAAAFVTMTVLGPDISASKRPSVTAPWQAGGTLELSGPDNDIPFGKDRQVQISLHPKASNGQPSTQLLGMGRSIPFDLAYGDPARELSTYVTPPNRYVLAFGDDGITAKTGIRVGAAAVVMPDHNVLFIGGAEPHQGATEPFKMASYGNYSKTVAEYDPNLRATLSQPRWSGVGGARLSKGRAFAGAALGDGGLVAIAGGYVLVGDQPKESDMVEFVDPAVGTMQKSAATNPDLEYARAHHSMTHLFNNYFLVVGGLGPSQAVSHWELWHPQHGRRESGELSQPRWNHATVNVPVAGGGLVLLIGGENDDGPIANLEIIRYDNVLNIAYKGNGKVGCQVGKSIYTTSKCKQLEGSAGYKDISWEPVLKDLPGKVGRTLAGAAMIMHGGRPLVAIVGGFLDSDKTKVSDRIDIYDPHAEGWLSHQLALETSRGAPQVTTTGNIGAPAVLISGGVGSDRKTVASGEVLSWPNADKASKPLRKRVVNDQPEGGRLFGVAVPLSTGHVLLTGGATTEKNDVSGHPGLSLWLPEVP